MSQGEKRGRKPLKDYQTSYKIQKEAIQWVLKYFYQYNVKDKFKKGSLSYGVVEDTIKIEYTPKDGAKQFLEFKVVLGNRRRADELRMLIQDFIVDLYFIHEWDGQPLGNKEMSEIFGVSTQDMNQIMRKIKDGLQENADLLGYAN